MAMNFPNAPVSNEFSNGGFFAGFRWIVAEGVWRQAKPKIILNAPIATIFPTVNSTYSVPAHMKSYQIRLDSAKCSGATSSPMYMPMLHVNGRTSGSHEWTATYSDHTVPATTTMAGFQSDQNTYNSCGIPVSIYAMNHQWDTANAIIDIDTGVSSGPKNSVLVQSGSRAQGFMTYALIAGTGKSSLYIYQIQFTFMNAAGTGGSPLAPTSGNFMLIGYE